MNIIAPTQATSFVNYFESKLSEMSRIIKSSEAHADINEKPRRASTSPQRFLQGEAKEQMIRDVLALVNDGDSWANAVAQRGQGYNVTSVINYAKQRKLFKPSISRKQHEANRKHAEKKLVEVERRRANGETLKAALTKEDITESQYYRAKQRAAR